MKYDADKLKAEIERLKDEYTDIDIDSHYGTVNANSVVDDLEQLLFLLDSLQQEQPKEICFKCIYHGKDDDYCYYPHGGMQSKINENGVCECTGFYEKEQEQPDKYETALEKAREWMPNVNQGGHAILIDIFPELGEGLDPRYCSRKKEQPEVDLASEIEAASKRYPEVSYAKLSRIAKRFYELGQCNARKEEI